MTTLILGYGVSGKGAKELLDALHKKTIVADKKASGCVLDDESLSLEGIDQVVLSPGIPESHPLVVKAKAKGIEVIGEIELAARHLKNRCFGCTGSNGKTTTVLLTEHVLKSSGRKAKALGNVGSSLCSYAARADVEEILLIELSSFQLETLEFPLLETALVLNITANHLDRYESLQEYMRAKARIQKIAGITWISKQVQEAFGEYFADAKCFDLDWNEGLGYIELEMVSKQSMSAAYLLCKRCGVNDEEFLSALKTFKKPAHRLEWVAEIDGVSYYNDSKSSNVHSTMHALKQVDGRLVLIAGGVHKGSSYMPWREFKEKVSCMIAYGEAAPLMEVELAGHFPFCKTEKFIDAVRLAKEKAKPNEKVLLSPGCSSYDQFASYEHRGNEFKRLVEEMK